MAFTDLLTLVRNNFKVVVFIIMLSLLMLILMTGINPIQEKMMYYIELLSS